MTPAEALTLIPAVNGSSSQVRRVLLRAMWMTLGAVLASLYTERGIYLGQRRGKNLTRVGAAVRFARSDTAVKKAARQA
jgi:hypothetical protein